MQHLDKLRNERKTKKLKEKEKSIIIEQKPEPEVVKPVSFVEIHDFD